MIEEYILDIDDPVYTMDVDDDVGEEMSGSLALQISNYELPPATTTELGGIIVGDDLQITQEGILSVVKANAVESDNTHPITAAAVYVEVGNINALLQTI